MKSLTILFAPNGVGGVTASKLEKRRCLECPKTEKQSAGFVPVDGEGNYLLSIDEQHLLAAVEIQTRRVNQFHDLKALWEAKRADKLEELERLNIEKDEKYRAAARAADKAKREQAKKQGGEK